MIFVLGKVQGLAWPKQRPAQGGVECMPNFDKTHSQGFYCA
jgi:hypothetical protein